MTDNKNKLREGNEIITEDEKYTIIAIVGNRDNSRDKERDKKAIFRRERDNKFFFKNLTKLEENTT